jgi:hypothetical protein
MQHNPGYPSSINKFSEGEPYAERSRATSIPAHCSPFHTLPPLYILELVKASLHTHDDFMKLIFILPSLCLTLLTSHADEAVTEAITPAPSTTLKADKVVEPTVDPLLNLIKDEPFWVLHSISPKWSF